MQEDNFINLIKQILPESSEFIGDDTAYIKEDNLILTKDVLIEDVHFRLSTISAYDLGYKALAVNLSDIAASGGVAKYILIGFSAPKTISENFVRDFYEGMKELTTRHNAKIIGGDITSAEKLCISITVIGKSEGINPAKRNTAKPGELVITTGFYGSSAAGLLILESPENPKFKEFPDFVLKKFINVHNRPTPQLGFGRIIATLSQPNPTMMDSSDGLADALYKIAKASDVDLEIDLNLVPIDPDLELLAEATGQNKFDLALYGGEDYQIIATVEQTVYENLSKNNIPIRKIGIVKETSTDPKVIMKNQNDSFIINQEVIDKKVFNHFG